MAETHDPNADATSTPTVRHETRDINLRGVLAFAVGLALTALFIHFAVWVLFVYFNGRESVKVTPQYPLAVSQENRLPPEPRLQTNPRQDLRDLRAAEEKTLNGYSWVDRNNGVVHIPIDQAMKLTLQRGLPARQEAHDRK
ncbi:MAG: hypothetical protein ACREFI_05660 [Stellaceae bacterium]